MNQYTDIRNKIDSFLAERRKSEGGYALITDQDVKDLSGIIRGLIELKCERDPDGDLPIQFALCNRRTHHFAVDPWINTVPYRDDEEDEDGRYRVNPLERGGRLEKLMFIVNSATSQLSSEMDVAQYLHSLYNEPQT